MICTSMVPAVVGATMLVSAGESQRVYRDMGDKDGLVPLFCGSAYVLYAYFAASAFFQHWDSRYTGACILARVVLGVVALLVWLESPRKRTMAGWTYLLAAALTVIEVAGLVWLFFPRAPARARSACHDDVPEVCMGPRFTLTPPQAPWPSRWRWPRAIRRWPRVPLPRRCRIHPR